MNQDIHNEAIQYEILTKEIYTAILKKEGINNIEVEHNISLEGRSGVQHQIDVLWRFKQAGIEHAVLIECKNYASNLTLEKTRNFFGVLHDIGNVRGIIVTKTGYQSGAAKFANYYGIKLKILRKPNTEDWKGRIKDIHIHFDRKTLSTNDEKPLKVKIVFHTEDKNEEEAKQINELIESGKLNYSFTPESYFFNEDNEVASEKIKTWLPSQLHILDKEDEGPYTEIISLEDKYILINEGESNQGLVGVEKLEVTYYVDTFRVETVSYGEEIVDAILRDFDTEEVEYVKRNEDKL